MNVAAKPKNYASYIKTPPDWWASTPEAYKKLPAVTLLKEVIDIGDSIRHCKRTFNTTKSKKLNKDSQDSLFRLSASALVSIMGHFETY